MNTQTEDGAIETERDAFVVEVKTSIMEIRSDISEVKSAVVSPAPQQATDAGVSESSSSQFPRGGYFGYKDFPDFPGRYRDYPEFKNTGQNVFSPSSKLSLQLSIFDNMLDGS